LTTKPFEQHLYDKYDNLGKQALLSYLEQEGHTVKNIKENYFADIVTEKDGREFYSEAEVRASWKGPWPRSWSELRLPGRKVRLLREYDEVTFFVFRDDCLECFIVESKELTKDRLKTAHGPNIRPGELFFHIPVNKVKLIQFKNGKWN